MENSEEKRNLKEKFRSDLLKHVELFNAAVSTGDGAWVVKGFIDIARNIYTISVDTKVVSKIMELLLFPKICQFAQDNGYKMVLCKEQNFYPDITFINSKKNITFSYDEYVGHFVLGVIYSRTDKDLDERKIYELDDLQNITSVVREFAFFVQEKYRIALDRPGSGNTKNIGSVTKIDELIHGKGPFVELGEDVFDDYWMYYLTKDMARAVDLKGAPYKNLREYKEYKKLKK